MSTKILACFSLLFIILASCKNEQEDTTYYSSNNLKSIKLFDQDTLVRTVVFYDSIINVKFSEVIHKKTHDSIAYFYNNGQLHKTGIRTKRGDIFGKWHFYTREGFLSETREYIVLDNMDSRGVKLNQIWFYNQEGDTMYYGNNDFNVYDQYEFRENSTRFKESIFVNFDFTPEGDTLSISEPFKALAEDGHPLWKHKNSESYVVLGKENNNFNSDFSNERQVKADTFFCLEKDIQNRKNFSQFNQRNTVAFGRWFDTPGRKVIRGYMVEKYTNNKMQKDSILGESRRTYFEKILYVKDTIR